LLSLFSLLFFIMLTSGVEDLVTINLVDFNYHFLHVLLRRGCLLGHWVVIGFDICVVLDLTLLILVIFFSQLTLLILIIIFYTCCCEEGVYWVMKRIAVD